ncbi:MAG: bifunctional hydroxymethylpyrimidine kinase/phosphomethylpyrimidine kinase [Xanthomonadales bacterium]|nr:Hydroxymethylpyrimidine/phosphomethylpyrimidine kinase [Xanthomonadales bacterium]MCC6591969.1 bifunctional hydroxymethylpyrimidine kinase/phosphomethylpyrimidine kinase [Xanthomonadales bacterium]MCE7929904.1 bifunctional hydroxymethylpyrimidine kinase/phosphomethylpyrimidine kinase [Xanthomonadales bacterium PRO6]
MPAIFRPRACALTIAGSDSGGGAGIQADLRAFASQGVFGLSAITALTAQNSRAVRSVAVQRPGFVRAQIDAVFDDYPVGAAKTGMLASAGIVRAVLRALVGRNLSLVVDPVMIASSGARLLDAAAERALEPLLQRAHLLTPNVPEAEVLLGRRIRRVADMPSAAEALRARGAHAVLLKGGHLAGKEVVDCYCDADGIVEFRSERRRLRGHGTGCTLAALLTARLALGERDREAVTTAIAAFRVALQCGAEVGKGKVWVPYPVGRGLR